MLPSATTSAGTLVRPSSASSLPSRAAAAAYANAAALPHRSAPGHPAAAATAAAAAGALPLTLESGSSLEARLLSVERSLAPASALEHRLVTLERATRNATKTLPHDAISRMWGALNRVQYRLQTVERALQPHAHLTSAVTRGTANVAGGGVGGGVVASRGFEDRSAARRVAMHPNTRFQQKPAGAGCGSSIGHGSGSGGDGKPRSCSGCGVEDSSIGADLKSRSACFVDGDLFPPTAGESLPMAGEALLASIPSLLASVETGGDTSLAPRLHSPIDSPAHPASRASSRLSSQPPSVAGSKPNSRPASAIRTGRAGAPPMVPSGGWHLGVLD